MSLLDRAKQKFGSDNATAKAVGVSRQYVSLVRKGERPLSPDVARDIAVAIGADPLKESLYALVEQAKSEKDRQGWLSVIQYLDAQNFSAVGAGKILARINSLEDACNCRTQVIDKAKIISELLERLGRNDKGKPLETTRSSAQKKTPPKRGFLFGGLIATDPASRGT